MNSRYTLDILHNTALFKDVDNADLKEIIKTAHFLQFKKNEFLIRENTFANEIYIVSKGKFIVTKSGSLDNDDYKADLTTLQPYDTVGEFAFLDEQPRSANVIAKDDDCEVLAIPYHHLKKMTLPVLYQTIAKKLSLNIRKSNEVILQKIKEELEHNKKLVNMGRFITYVLFLMAFYDLALKGFVSLANNTYTSMFASTSVIAIFTFVLYIMIRKMGNRLKDYGVNTNNWKQAIPESIFFSSIFLIILTGIKGMYSFKHHIPLIDLQAIVPIANLYSFQFFIWYITGIVIYIIFSIFQEFISRGILQSSLIHFLQHDHRYLHANIITSAIFSAMHIHLSATLALVVFIPSFFWGWLYNRHRTLISPIISHIMIGTWAVFILGIQGLL